MWNRPCRVLPAVLLALGSPAWAQVDVAIVADEAEAVLAILASREAGREPGEGDWQRLFQSEGYRRLAAREAEFRRTIEAGTFKAFVTGKDLLDKAPALSRTLQAWRSADVAACARKSLAYLPAEATIRARIYPVIKPRGNSFVFEGNAIFLFIDPAQSRERFENTLIHELHHIGYASLKPDPAVVAEIARLPAAVREAGEWVSAFGEGFAMLAAAGGPDIHPHAVSPAEDRQRWDRDMATFDANLKDVETFLLDVAEGRLQGDAAQAKGMSYFGIQGPWYTVGWRMASTIEQVMGKPALLDCMKDLRKLLPTFNEAVAKGKRPYATWSPRLLERLAGN